MTGRVNNLLGNQFGPITPEQQAMLQRDAVQPSMGPFDLFPMTGLGAGIGAGTAAVGGLRSLMSDPRRAAALMEYLKGIGAVGGAGAGMGFMFDARNMTRDYQQQRDMEREAEMLPGAFPLNNLLR